MQIGGGGMAGGAVVTGVTALPVTGGASALLIVGGGIEFVAGAIVFGHGAYVTYQSASQIADDMRSGGVVHSTGSGPTSPSSSPGKKSSPKPPSSKGNPSAKASSQGPSPYKEYDLVPYDNQTFPTPGFEKHHGILNQWAEKNLVGYTKSNAPTVLLDPAKHELTKQVYREWLRTNYGKPVGVSPNWKSVPREEAMKLTEDMFDAASVPSSTRQEFYKHFDDFRLQQ